MAQELARALRTKLPKAKVAIKPTKYAGHAEELAYEIAVAFKQPLIISASGDGGYNEVVNGAMRAIAKGHQPIVGLLPAGNANDHYQSLHEGDIVEAIIAHKYREIDVLKMNIADSATSLTRYAHSYIGLGLSPRVGKKLTQAKLNKFNQIWLTLRALLRKPRCKIEIDGTTQTYDNFVISNTPRMAKVITFAPNSKIDDGRFEVTKHIYEGNFRMFTHLLKASSVGLSDPDVRRTLTLRTRRKTSVQVDGEVIALKEPADITITSLHKALKCFV
jgi:diacylglycerol kinase family enzyme